MLDGDRADLDFVQHPLYYIQHTALQLSVDPRHIILLTYAKLFLYFSPLKKSGVLFTFITVLLLDFLSSSLQIPPSVNGCDEVDSYNINRHVLLSEFCRIMCITNTILILIWNACINIHFQLLKWMVNIPVR